MSSKDRQVEWHLCALQSLAFGGRGGGGKSVFLADTESFQFISHFPSRVQTALVWIHVRVEGDEDRIKRNDLEYTNSCVYLCGLSSVGLYVKGLL